MQIRIDEIHEDKKRFLPLLLLADEQEDMIDRYLPHGRMFVLYDEGILCSLCVITPEDEQTAEIKNIATEPKRQRQGYGRLLINHVCRLYQAEKSFMQLGTGEVPSALSFYTACGFAYSHRIKNFFTDNYREPIFEDGIQLVDMVYLKKSLSANSAAKNAASHK